MRSSLFLLICGIFFRNVTRNYKYFIASQFDFQQSHKQKKNPDSWKLFSKWIVPNSCKKELTQTTISVTTLVRSLRAT